MVSYVFVDPNVGDLMMERDQPPNDVGRWWPVPDYTDINTVYIDEEGELSIRPPKPEPHMEFNYRLKVWYDPRTPAEIAQAEARRRATVDVDRADLILALVDGGHFPEVEAVEASRGVITPRLEALAFRDRVKFAGRVTFRRNDAIVMKLMVALNITPSQMNEAFDIAIASEIP